MAATKTSLSAGYIIHDNLRRGLKGKVSKIFPVVSDSAELPYVVYRRVQFEQEPTKQRTKNDVIEVEVLCCTADYLAGIELAEAVRDSLDGAQGEIDGLVMRSCYISDSEEIWQDDAYIQRLVFTIKI